MNVGIISVSKDFSHPADRRRAIYFLKNLDIDYEVAKYEKRYSHVYITIAADLSLWSTYKAQWDDLQPKPRVIFDFCDDLLAASLVQDHLRAVFYYIIGKNKRFNPSYKTTILEMISCADLVVCGSAEQKSKLDRVHPNVLVVRDYFGADIRIKKMDYSLSSENKLNIFWEGLSHGNIEIFRQLREIVDSINGYEVHLHIATDPVYCRIGGRLFCKSTFEVLRDIFKGSAVKFHLYDWSSATFSAIATSCDFAVIPIPQNSIMRMKPENKLLLLWQLGLPVVASDTESYSRAMEKAELDYVASTPSDWKEMILRLINSVENRKDYVNRAQSYLERFCSEEAILSSWREIFKRNWS
jgi:hypothetical protein